MDKDVGPKEKGIVRSRNDMGRLNRKLRLKIRVKEPGIPKQKKPQRLSAGAKLGVKGGWPLQHRSMDQFSVEIW